MAATTKNYLVMPVQADDAAIPASHHVGNLLIPIPEGEVVELTWGGSGGDPSVALGADIVGVTVLLLQGSVRHAFTDDESTGGVAGTEPVIDAPATIVLSEGYTEQFEPVGRETALLMLSAYNADAVAAPPTVYEAPA